MEENALLSVERLTLSLKGRKTQTPLVNQVEFDLFPEKIMGLIGASGCGKSLTCLAVMGLLPSGIVQTEGAIRFQTEEIHCLPPDRMQTLRGNKLAMILQNPMSCFDPVFTIKHHFAETLASHRRDVKDSKAIHQTFKIKDALYEVGFDDPDHILSLYPFQMSGGMLQRVMIALALLMEVKLLIADEPTTDLDVVAQARVLDLLSGMRKKHGMSILLVTHDLSVMAYLADEVMVMQNGTIVERGPVRQIFSRGRHPYTVSLVKAHLDLYDDHLIRLMETDIPYPVKMSAAFR